MPQSYDYLRDPGGDLPRSFARIREEADLARLPRALQPLALRLAHAAGDAAILDDLAWSRRRRRGRARARSPPARRSWSMRRWSRPASSSAACRAGTSCCACTRRRARAGAGGAAGNDALGRRGRAVAAASRRRGRRDRQRADRAVSPARDARRRRAQAGARARAFRSALSAPPRPRRRSPNIGCGLRLHRARRAGAAAARSPPRRSTRLLARIGDERRGSPSSASARTGSPGFAPAARALVETAEMLVGGARHLALVPAGAAERIAWRQPARRRRSTRSRRGAAGGSSCWRAATRCGTASAPCLPAHFPPEEMTILPQPSAFSLAAARLGWPLADCVALSLHGRPLETLRLHLAPRRALLIAVGGWRRRRAQVARAAAPTPAGGRAGDHRARASGRRRASGASTPPPQHGASGRVADLNTHRARVPARARGASRCRASPACPTTPSSMTAS